LLGVHANAQTTQPQLAARLVKRPLYLRGCWKEDLLHFDSDGSFGGTDHPIVPFTLAGMDVAEVALDNEKLTVTGTRAALEFLPTGPTRVLLGEVLKVVVNAPPNGDYGPALNKIFADGLADLTPSLPSFWQPYAQETFLHKSPAPSLAPASGITPPLLVKHPNPGYTELGRMLQYSGTVQLHVQVRKDGSVGDIHVRQPIGLGLDEAAQAAVSRYVYKPARENGDAVTAERDVDVNFVAKPY
jgi:protein TonB